MTPAYRRPRVHRPEDLSAGTHYKKLSTAGSFRLDNVSYMVGGPHRQQHVLIVEDGDHLTVVTLAGEVLIEHTRPDSGIRYVGNNRPPGPRPSPKS